MSSVPDGGSDTGHGNRYYPLLGERGSGDYSTTNEVEPVDCLFCGSNLGIIRIHGHTQCKACGAVIERCCE